MRKKNAASEKERRKITQETKILSHMQRRIFNEDENYRRVRDYCHYTGKSRGVAHSICNLRYNTSKEIPLVFHNGSNYDYHLIIKELAEEFEGQFFVLGENIEKHRTFSVPLEK